MLKEGFCISLVRIGVKVFLYRSDEGPYGQSAAVLARAHVHANSPGRHSPPESAFVIIRLLSTAPGEVSPVGRESRVREAAQIYVVSTSLFQ